jgi:hypothetical protein
LLEIQKGAENSIPKTPVPKRAGTLLELIATCYVLGK